MQPEYFHTVQLPPGMELYPLYDKCPRCGCDLQNFYEANQAKHAQKDQGQSNNVEQIADNAGFSLVAADFPIRPAEAVEHEGFLIGVVNPLTDTPEEKTSRNQSRWFDWVGGKEPGSVKQEHERTRSDENFVPRIKCKFRQRIFHFLFRLLGGRYE